MKRIVAYVFPVAGGSVDTEPPALPSAASSQNGAAQDTTAERPDREPLRLEALLSDAQAQRVLSLLMEQESVVDTRLLIEEMLDKQLRLTEPESGDLFEKIVLEVERQLLTQVFDNCERVKTKAAARLGIDRNTLHKKLRKYNLDQEPA